MTESVNDKAFVASANAEALEESRRHKKNQATVLKARKMASVIFCYTAKLWISSLPYLGHVTIAYYMCFFFFFEFLFLYLQSGERKIYLYRPDR